MSVDESSSLLILADDLTGAADSAARCCGAGLASAIKLGTPQLPLTRPAVAFTTDSRHVNAEEAAARVRRAVAPFAGERAIAWYKKIDSTLRGHIGQELEAMLDALSQGERQEPWALICPSFPAQQRGLEHGYVVHAQTPPRTVHLPSLLRHQSRLEFGCIDLADVRGGVDALEQALRAARRGGARLVSVDALRDEDLQTIHAAAARLPGALYCGSAGLAGVLARAMAGETGAVRPPGLQAAPMRGPVLVVAGSGSAMARSQIDAVRHSGTAEVVELDGAPEPEGIAVSDGNVLCCLPEPEAGAVLEGEAARVHAARLAALAVVAVERLAPGAVILVGGDTATATLRALGVERLDVERELMPGMPLARGTDRQGRARVFVLKAGNHGTESTLCELIGMLEA